MEQQVENILDTDQFAFGDDVIEASNEQLVLVDFWAPWCGPCRSLGPILEKLVGDYQGAIRLVKVNADEQQALCGHYGVRSLPTVYFFKNGEVVEQFMGAQPESAIKELIDNHVPQKEDNVLQRIVHVYESGETDSAIAALGNLIENEPTNDELKMTMMQWLAQEDRLSESKEMAESLSTDAKASPEYRSFSAYISFCEAAEDAPSIEELTQAIEADPDDLGSRCQLANQLVIQQQYAPAMDQLLEVIKKNRMFNDEAARHAMVSIFHLLGGQGELVSHYRSLLARTLN